MYKRQHLSKNHTLIDLAADFRLEKASDYLKWYKQKHRATNLIKKSIYLLPEINRKEIKKYNIISCPGCYPTSILLPLIPLLKKNLIKELKCDTVAFAGRKYTGLAEEVKQDIIPIVVSFDVNISGKVTNVIGSSIADSSVAKNLLNNAKVGDNVMFKDIIVSIDAGHGGRDPGAVGTNNVLEKDINLLIAKELERTLRDVKGYKPVMIRNDDSFVDLNERYLRARREAADISISIHADGFRLSSVKGASVFIWSKEYSSITAENLSKKQLKSKIGEIDEEDFDEDKAQVKYPAKYKSKLDESKKLGNSILAQLKEDPYTKLHKKNVEYADFRVLKSFDTPSVLVEAGFISNPDDAERLKGKPGRRMIARSIFLGIHDYFKKNKHSESRFDSNSEYVPVSYTHLTLPTKA